MVLLLLLLPLMPTEVLVQRPPQIRNIFAPCAEDWMLLDVFWMDNLIRTLNVFLLFFDFLLYICVWIFAWILAYLMFRYDTHFFSFLLLWTCYSTPFCYLPFSNIPFFVYNVPIEHEPSLALLILKSGFQNNEISLK